MVARYRKPWSLLMTTAIVAVGVFPDLRIRGVTQVQIGYMLALNATGRQKAGKGRGQLAIYQKFHEA